MDSDWKRIVKVASFYLLVAFIVLYAVIPFLYAISSSFKSGNALYDPSMIPSDPSFDNYVSVFSQQPFHLNFLNSVVVSFVVVTLSLFLGLTAAYALARIRFRGRKLLLFTILGVSMFPQVAVLSGMYEVVSLFNMYDELPSLMFSYMILTLPFTVWVLTTFMRNLPGELEEAAIMDGATPWQTITKVFMPLMWPAMVTTGLLAFINAWNEFLFALSFTLSNEQRTVPVAIALMSGSDPREIPWGSIMAGSVIVTVPLIILVLLFQRRIVAGLTQGAVKG
ncbi:MAG: carbohydrate ABC transporter permease [Haliangiales bacterium]